MTSEAAASPLGFEPFAQVIPSERRAQSTETDIQTIIGAAYRQLFGNDHIMRAERLTSTDSLFKQGHITVRDFVRALAHSDLYKHKFFSDNPQVRFIELNFKHFLGRAPYDQTEISEHVDLYVEKGYDAEINSYFDSAEYRDTFGDHIVPYYRGFATQRNQKTVGFARMFQLYRGYASSDRARANNKKGTLTTELATNTATPISTPKFGKALQGTTRGKQEKLYRIRVSQSASGRTPQIRRGIQEYLVSYEQLSPTLQRLNKRGSRVVNITSA